jgi:hypothetical protein
MALREPSPAERSAPARPIPLLALPLVGTGFGGGAAISGQMTLRRFGGSS